MIHSFQIDLDTFFFLVVVVVAISFRNEHYILQDEMNIGSGLKEPI